MPEEAAAQAIHRLGRRETKTLLLEKNGRHRGTPSAAAASPSAAGGAAAAAPPVSPLKFLEDARAAALAEIDEHVATLR